MYNPVSNPEQVDFPTTLIIFVHLSFAIDHLDSYPEYTTRGITKLHVVTEHINIRNNQLNIAVSICLMQGTLTNLTRNS